MGTLSIAEAVSGGHLWSMRTGYGQQQWDVIDIDVKRFGQRRDVTEVR